MIKTAIAALRAQPLGSAGRVMHGLRLRVFAGVLLLNLLVGLLGLAFIQSSRTAAYEHAAVVTRSFSNLIERDISGRLDRVDLALQLVVHEVERQLSSPHPGQRTLWHLVDDSLELTPEAGRISIFDAQGDRVCRGKAANCEHLNIADREHFRQAQAEKGSRTLMSGPLQSRSLGRWSILLSRALRHADGRFAGLAVAVVPLEAIQKAFVSLDLGKHGAVSLRHESLALLVRHPGPMRMAREEDNRKVSVQLAQAVKAHPAGGSYQAPTAIDGIERENAYRKFDKYPLYIIVGLGTADFLREWWSSLYLTAGLGLAFALSTIALALAVLSSIQRLAAGEARLNSVLQTMSEGVILHDGEGRVIEANTAAADILGLEREQLLRLQAMKPEWQTIEEDGSPLSAAAHPTRVTLATGRSVHEQVIGIFVDPNQGRRWLSVNTGALFDPGGSSPIGVVASITDITERRQTHEALANSERRLRLASDAGQVGVWDLDLASGLAWRSDRHARIFGYAAATDDWTLSRLLDHVLPEDREHVRRCIQTGRNTGAVCFDCRILRVDGAVRWIAIHGEALRDAKGTPTHLMGSAQDITERRQREDELRVNDAVLRNMQEGVCLAQASSGLIVFTNGKFDDMFGYAAGELKGLPVSRLNAPSTKSPEAVAAEIIAALEECGAWHGDVHNLRKDGSAFWCSATVSSLQHQQLGTVWVAVHQNITERKRTEQQLQAANRQLELLARHDPLTGLCNRRWMGELMQRALIEALRGDYALSFVMIDIDHFKRVNDSHGHAAGDAVLVAFANMLQGICRATDALCRYGGEEFLLVLPRATESGARQRAEQLRLMSEALRVDHDGQTLGITVSQGIAVFPAAGTSVEDLISQADHALYEAKRAGRNAVCVAQ